MDFISRVDTCKKPAQDKMMQFCAPFLAEMENTEKLKMTRKKALRAFDHHHSALNTIVSSFVWISFYPPNLPAAKAQDGIESTQFHLNRVLTKSGKTDENKAFCVASKAFLAKQKDLVKQYYKTGL